MTKRDHAALFNKGLGLRSLAIHAVLLIKNVSFEVGVQVQVGILQVGIPMQRLEIKLNYYIT
jgi:hypothetical protein